MKIVLLIRRLETGGAERQLVLLAHGLKEKGHDVKVVTFYPGGSLERELEAIPIAAIGKRGRWDFVRFFVRAAILLRREKPDAVYSFLHGPNLLATALKPFLKGTRIVWAIRSTYMDWSRFHWLSGLTYRAAAVVSRFADAIVVNSASGMEYHRTQGFFPGRMVSIPNGIDTEKFHPDRTAGEAFRNELGVSPDQKLIGIVGRLDPMKDHPTFLKAASLLAGRRNDLRFVCVGDGPTDYRSELETFTKDLKINGAVVWAGERKDVFPVYNALDLLVSSSIGEGFPNVIGEAMACGVPCVATDVGDSAAIVGETGVIVQPADPEALAAGIERLLSSAPAADAIRDRIEKNFSAASLAQKTERILS